MTTQMDVFSGADYRPTTRDGQAAQDFPDGFRYAPELMTPEEEGELLAHIRELPFREFEFHGYKGKRRVVSYGWQYDFSARQLNKADDAPEFLRGLREVAAQCAAVDPLDLQHILVTEYGPGSGIGWHIDKKEFGIVVGISLFSPCVFRMRRSVGPRRWERVSLIVEPRSAYVLSGVVRDEWEHSIPPVNSLRYSVTFRNLRVDA